MGGDEIITLVGLTGEGEAEEVLLVDMLRECLFDYVMTSCE